MALAAGYCWVYGVGTGGGGDCLMGVGGGGEDITIGGGEAGEGGGSEGGGGMGLGLIGAAPALDGAALEAYLRMCIL